VNKTSIAMAVALGLSLLASGCSSSTDSGTPSDQRNEADIAFAQDMIPHHEQAIEMAEIASESDDPTIRDLARKIERQQGPEIRRMKNLLQDWGASMGMGEHHMAAMPGMMAEGERQELKAASGVALDRMFLTMMIEHHKGAIEMAEMEIDEGESEDAIALAEDIVQAQRSEIEEMQQLLGQISS
jgi:uncharacterized protein (DUF305 family)